MLVALLVHPMDIQICCRFQVVALHRLRPAIPFPQHIIYNHQIKATAKIGEYTPFQMQLLLVDA